MSGLADLFSESSPPPPSPRPISPLPNTPPRRRGSSDPLFLSPGGTPQRSGEPSYQIRSTPAVVSVQGYDPITDVNGRIGEGGGDIRDDIYGGYDPLDLTVFGQDGIVDGGIEDDQNGKKKRVMAKIDAERLTGDRGIPALMRVAKRFKPRGKGHEEKDLKDILNLYQIWAHGMFPKGDFEGTVKRVETVCRTRRMEIAMKGYKEAFYPPPPRSPSPPVLSPLPNSPLLPTADVPVDHPHSPTEFAQERNGERRSSEPLFDTVDREEEADGPDLEELMAMEEMEREQAIVGASAVPPVSIPREEEEDEWEGLYD